jgi:cold shock CspA family protein
MGERLSGSVKWFRSGALGKGGGYGFIAADPPLPTDVFFHLTDMHGYGDCRIRELPANTAVTFELSYQDGVVPNRLRARDVVVTAPGMMKVVPTECPAVANDTHTGLIKKVLEQRGFGFIVADSALGRDVFFQVKDLVGFPAVKSLPAETRVSFRLVEHPNGFRATHVRAIAGDQDAA